MSSGGRGGVPHSDSDAAGCELCRELLEVLPERLAHARVAGVVKRARRPHARTARARAPGELVLQAQRLRVVVVHPVQHAAKTDQCREVDATLMPRP